MLHLNNWTETWRDQLIDYMDQADAASGEDRDASYYDDWADELKRRVGNALLDAGIDYEYTSRQSVGTGAILQFSSTEAEEAKFNEILESETARVGAELLAAESHPAVE